MSAAILACHYKAHGMTCGLAGGGVLLVYFSAVFGLLMSLSCYHEVRKHVRRDREKAEAESRNRAVRT